MSGFPTVGPPPDDIEALFRAWESRDAAEWRQPGPYLEFGRQAIALGQPTLGFDILKEGLAAFPEHAEMHYFAALALAKSGARGYAASLLDRLLAATDLDLRLRSEALSLAGRLAKDRWAVLGETASRGRVAEQARERYHQAYALSRDYFPGINAATMSVLCGRVEDGRRIAREVSDRCRAAARGGGEPDHWLCATLGEASVLLGERDEALRWYTQASERAGRRYGDIASMRRQLKLLATRLDLAGEMLGALGIPRVALFAGHMMDRPGRMPERFPPRLVPAVERELTRALARADVGFAYCSAACGADLLFIEQALARGVEVNIVLPFGREDFVRTSVALAGTEWVERFERALAGAATVSTCVDEGHLGDDVLYVFAGQQVQGLALLRAEQLESPPLLMAVADPASASEPGGTWANVLAWRALERETRFIDLGALRGGTQTPAPAVAPADDLQPREEHRPFWGRRQIRTMLFADVVGFSKLREEEAPSFFVNFLGLVARQIEQSAVAPVASNTWGDGLYIVFDDVVAAADFSLRLRDRIARTDWQSQGLPVGLSVRIGMHSGPVFQAFDPIIQRNSFFGSHVTRAARIEPVTAPGSVYVSEQTAALLAAGGNRDFACDYLGRLALAKGYGGMTLYRLRRAKEEE